MTFQKTRRRRAVVGLLTIVCYASGDRVDAYLDPSTGNMLLQGLFALIAATVGAVGIYWRATLRFIRRFSRRDDRDGTGRGDSAE